eukprot:SAG31_NODE_15245_length_764_cov_0.691729_1_plen_89_part_00
MSPGNLMGSEIICGAMRFRGTPSETLAVVKDCVAMGVTTFDVAAVYGGGEAVRGVENNFGCMQQCAYDVLAADSCALPSSTVILAARC